MDVVFFRSSLSVFSNWHLHAPFVLDDHKFVCVEQYMMWRKARLFGDHESAARIQECSDPAEIQRLGRQVAGFKKREWDLHKEAIVEAGVRAKFEQNEAARFRLLATKGCLLAEASPWDKEWGVGLSEREARQVGPAKWPGKNLLGQILVRVREHLASQ